MCFEHQFVSNPPTDCDSDELVEIDVEDFLLLLITVEPGSITLEDVSHRLAELQPRKGPAPNSVPNTAQRLLPESGIQFLVDFF